MKKNSLFISIIIFMTLFSCGTPNGDKSERSQSQTESTQPKKIDVNELYDSIPYEYTSFSDRSLSLGKLVKVIPSSSQLAFSESAYGEIDLTKDISFGDYSKIQDIIKYLNKECGFSDDVYDKMCDTRVSDGNQYEENESAIVKWQLVNQEAGLVIVYEAKQS